jgi:hypothetical protein
MASMSSNTGVKTRSNGGFLKAILKKIFGGESLFVNDGPYCNWIHPFPADQEAQLTPQTSSTGAPASPEQQCSEPGHGRVGRGTATAATRV